MEYEVTFAPTPDGLKLAKLFVAVDRIRAGFDRYIWAAPAHRSEFNYQDETVHIFSYFDSDNIRITIWHDKTYGSWNAMIDATTRLGMRAVSIVEIGGPNERQIVSPDNFYLCDLTEEIMHGQDQDGNHGFAMSSASYVAELLDRQLKPWANNPAKPDYKLKPITQPFIETLVQLGYRSTGMNSWAAPGDNIGKVQ
ncbi:hypothetical protein NKI89_10210 [Mesorhizobium sp. M0309]|uniref:hypothetical protein n=1 Tax=Mesorhizobium sp. M0309 TaxID=2956933 RepID=UPI00333CBAC6